MNFDQWRDASRKSAGSARARNGAPAVRAALAWSNADIAARVAAQDARAGLFHHLSGERHHGIKLVAQALQRQLLYNVGRALHARGDFLREAFGLPCHPTGGIEQLTVGALEFLLALLSLAPPGAQVMKSRERMGWTAPGRG